MPTDTPNETKNDPKPKITSLAEAITTPRETLDIPGVKMIHTRGKTEMTLCPPYQSVEWRASIQLNEDHSITFLGDERGPMRIAWSILMAAQAVGAVCLWCPGEAGRLQFADRDQAEQVFQLAMTNPWMNP